MQTKQIMDGCTAATYIAYAFSDAATIYPITPIAEMGELADKWAAQGRLNLMGQTMEIHELESELGAAGATHGVASGGGLATTFTSSQGLMLMLPNMYKMAGNLLPVVFHVGARSLATHALSIFCDHSDVMATRATGFAMLCSNSVQETHDLAIVAHLAAIEGSVPVLHFFDGFRTSNEMQSIYVSEYEDLRPLVDWDKVDAIRRRGLNPEHPEMRGSAQNPDIFFQNREACNPYYDAMPAIIQAKMDAVAALTGRQYHLFDYVGDPDAEYVVVSMASSCEVIEETVADLCRKGVKAGLVKVRLYRPWSSKDLVAAIPASARVVAVLDRDKEPGAQGEPLFCDVCTSLFEAGRMIKVIGGRYGLGSKDFNPGMVKAVFDLMASPDPKPRFTVGINDDVTHLSIPFDGSYELTDPDTCQVEFYGIGGDGTVGSAKQAAAIIGSQPDYFAQAYFQYSAWKSGGYTISQLRVAKHPIKSEYQIVASDYVSCNKSTYLAKYDMLRRLKPGGIFVLNSIWSDAEMELMIPAAVKRQIAEKRIKFYNVDALAIARRHGLGGRINTIMEAVFFKLSGVMDIDDAIAAIGKQVEQMYIHEGQNVVDANKAAVADAVTAIRPIDYPASWAGAADTPADIEQKARVAAMPQWIREVAVPMLRLEGDALPVSKMSPSGTFPVGESAYEKRGVADFVPQWNADKCIECTECSVVCSHATIRPVVATADELAGAPESFVTKPAWPKPLQGMRWRIQLYPEDCTGCASCSVVCPAGALPMVPIASICKTECANLDFAQAHIKPKAGLLPRFSIDGSQLFTPLMEFSGACGGCGETPYVKLLTQLFGEHIVIANATGCSSIWSADAPSMTYCANENGLGPAWSNSLFEDNAEYAYGIEVAISRRRKGLIATAQRAVADSATDPALKTALQAWLDVVDDYDKSYAAGLEVKKFVAANPSAKYAAEIAAEADLLGRKSVWALGGDGWAYDIGFAGVDHVLASGRNINMLVLDTQCYSNTGGQMSKATPHGACAKYAFTGKRQYHKNLGEMMMTYRNVYVASVALGGNMAQVVEALREAEAYPGPSIVIAYCPCIAFGIKASMSHSVIVEREAVQNNFWPIYRFNPSATENPLQYDPATPLPESPAMPAPPKWSPKPWVHENIISFGESAPRNGADNPLIVDSGSDAPIEMAPMLDGENRYAVLSTRVAPDEASTLYDQLQDASQANVRRLKEM